MPGPTRGCVPGGVGVDASPQTRRSTPTAGQLAPARKGLWLLLILGVVLLVVALGAGIVVPTLLDDPEGWTLLFSAPAAGLVAGLAAGLIAARRRIRALGMVAALAGLALGVIFGTLTLPGGREAVSSDIWMALMLAITGVPLIAGYGTVVLVSLVWDLRGLRRASGMPPGPSWPVMLEPTWPVVAGPVGSLVRPAEDDDTPVRPVRGIEPSESATWWQVESTDLPDCPAGTIVWLDSDGSLLVIVRPGVGVVKALDAAHTTEEEREGGRVRIFRDPGRGFEIRLRTVDA